MRRLATPALILGLGAAALAFAVLRGGTPPAGAASGSEPVWTLPIGEIIDVPREGADEKMFCFELAIDAAGGPRLARTFLLRGRAPEFRPHEDLARIYRWELLDGRGALLDEGRFLDRLAVYVPNPEGPCDKSVLGDHAAMLRTAWHPDAASLRLRLESVHLTQDEEHQHR